MWIFKHPSITSEDYLKVIPCKQSFSERRSERALIWSERERERHSNSRWWALSASAPKISEREREFALIFALNMEPYLKEMSL